MSTAKPTRNQINILLLAQTGIGKSTVINALTSHLVYSSLDEAMQGPLQCIIPTVVYKPLSQDDQEIPVYVGTADSNERINQVGSSRTKECRTYVIKIGNKEVRLLDTPGVGDTEGVEQDVRNFENIMSHISQYDHLDGICILLQPLQTRLDAQYRYCIKELLTHLHKSAVENMVFLFTHGRSNFFRPGDAARILRTFLSELSGECGLEVPFNEDNTFRVDNESFGFLARIHNGIAVEEDEIGQVRKSWTRSEKEYIRLVEHLMTCEPHQVHETISLNEAKQLINKLHRPIAETTRLIEENIQLAKQHRDAQRDLSDVNIIEHSGENILLPQYEAQIIFLDYPRTVCTHETCTEVVTLGGVIQIDYSAHCHEHCYLDDVPREVIGHPKLRVCAAMEPSTGKCNKCGCIWSRHQHINYEYRHRIEPITLSVELKDSDECSSESSFDPSLFTQSRDSPEIVAINRHIGALKHERDKMLAEYVILVRFLRANALVPFNDDIVEYIKLFIDQERRKESLMQNNSGVIQGLQEALEMYKKQTELFKQASDISANTGRNSTSSNAEVPTLADILPTVEKLYELPINGKSIRDQVKGLKNVQVKSVQEREKALDLPLANSQSALLSTLKTS